MGIIDKSRLYPLLFEPIYKEIMWGGKMLQTHLQRTLPESTLPIAESWEISDRVDGISVIENGELRGRTIRELVENHGKDLIGQSFTGGRFPLLVKIIDAGKRLSLQVHPDEAACDRIGEGAEPKTEMWYIIAAQKGAKIIAGLEPNTTKQLFLEKVGSIEIEECLQIFDSIPGDAFYIKAGRIHAIDEGNLLLEIQQNSNTTYRVSDWGRIGPDGKPRELHVEKAMQCIDFKDRTSPRITGVSNSVEHTRKFPIIKMCPYFKVDDLRLKTKLRDTTLTSGSFHLITAINYPVLVGKEHDPVKVDPGRNCLVPACFGDYTILLTTEEETNVVRTTL